MAYQEDMWEYKVRLEKFCSKDVETTLKMHSN